MATMAELRAKVTELGHDPKGLNAEEMTVLIAKSFMTPDTPPQLGCMLIGRDSENVGDFDPKEWYMEPKVDDVRMQMQFFQGRVRMISRGRSVRNFLFIEKTANYPQFQGLYDESLEGTVIDGGLVMGINPRNKNRLWKGNDLFSMIGVNGSSPENAIRLQEQKGWARFICFDIVAFRGKSVAEWPIEKRQVLLGVVAEELGLDTLPRWIQGFEAGYALLMADGAEGAVFKKRGSPYVFYRSETWARVKRFDDVVAYIGSTGQAGEGRNSGKMGAVEIVDAEGRNLGFVGSLDDETRQRLTLTPTETNPEMVGRQVLVRFNGKNPQGGLRHARIIRWAEAGQDLAQVR